MLDEILLNAVTELINRASSDKKIKALSKKHSQKLHFIPLEYRILGGILQSMNIQFGNFIEELMKLLVKNSGFEILSISGKKNNKFSLSKQIEQEIDRYITRAQTEINFKIETEFLKLQDKIFNDTSTDTIEIKHDIDLLFKDDRGKIFYLEIKYNDDHDTGKFIDINRKFIKTYAYLVREFQIKKSADLKPILFYFNNKKMKGNIYLNESENIYRGERFFSEFLDISYDELKNKLLKFSQSEDNLQKFRQLYEKITKEQK